ncbi:UNVERIFIED_CONTAM: hypothetical protein K2H54_036485 [Gekko kuhli]
MEIEFKDTQILASGMPGYKTPSSTQTLFRFCKPLSQVLENAWVSAKAEDYFRSCQVGHDIRCSLGLLG